MTMRVRQERKARRGEGGKRARRARKAEETGDHGGRGRGRSVRKRGGGRSLSLFMLGHRLGHEHGVPYLESTVSIRFQHKGELSHFSPIHILLRQLLKDPLATAWLALFRYWPLRILASVEQHTLISHKLAALHGL